MAADWMKRRNSELAMTIADHQLQWDLGEGCTTSTSHVKCELMDRFFLNCFLFQENVVFLLIVSDKTNDGIVAGG